MKNLTILESRILALLSKQQFSDNYVLHFNTKAKDDFGLSLNKFRKILHKMEQSGKVVEVRHKGVLRWSKV